MDPRIVALMAMMHSKQPPIAGAQILPQGGPRMGSPGEQMHLAPSLEPKEDFAALRRVLMGVH